MEDAHVFKDPAKLEACIWYIHTTMPVPPSSLRGASAHRTLTLTLTLNLTLTLTLTLAL